MHAAPSTVLLDVKEIDLLADTKRIKASVNLVRLEFAGLVYDDTPRTSAGVASLIQIQATRHDALHFPTGQELILTLDPEVLGGVYEKLHGRSVGIEHLAATCHESWSPRTAAAKRIANPDEGRVGIDVGESPRSSTCFRVQSYAQPPRDATPT